MNLEQLRGFTEIARLGHFTRAAEELHLAQPSLSRQISTLEAELGVELFHRVRGNISLTAAGERLLPTAKRMLADADIARSEMAELAGLQRGRIRLGATPTLCTSLVVEVLAEFRERYPGIDIEILERGSRTLLDALMEGALDIALIVTSPSTKAGRGALEIEPLLRERLVVVSAEARSSPFQHSAAIELAELARMPQVAFPLNYELRTAMDAAFAAHGLTPNTVVEGAEMDAVLRFVERGIGAALVPVMVAANRAELHTTTLADANLNRTISLARRSDMTPTHAGAEMRRLVREVADRLARAEHGLVTRV